MASPAGFLCAEDITQVGPGVYGSHTKIRAAQWSSPGECCWIGWWLRYPIPCRSVALSVSAAHPILRSEEMGDPAVKSGSRGRTVGLAVRGLGMCSSPLPLRIHIGSL